MTIPAVSVVVPVYNVAPYLEQCIGSVLDQTLGDLELLLVNDGSTDRSTAICDSYASQDNRVRVTHQPNAGLSAARNAGLALASGEFVTFLDGDDWLDRDTLLRTHQAAHRNCADVVMWPYVREYENLSLPKRVFDFEERVFDEEETRRLLCRRMVGLLDTELAEPQQADTLVTACAKLYRRDLLVTSGVNFVDTAIIGTEDAFFNLQALTHARRAVYLNQFMYHYRRDNALSVTTRHKPRLAMQWEVLHSLMRQHIAEHDLGDDFEQALRNRVALSIIGLGLNALTSDTSVRSTVQEFRRILSAEEYRSAINTLETGWLPAHWRLFFSAARREDAVSVYAALRSIELLRVWRNRGR